MKQKQAEEILALRDRLKKLTRDERLEVFAGYCHRCGSDEPDCWKHHLDDDDSPSRDE